MGVHGGVGSGGYSGGRCCGYLIWVVVVCVTVALPVSRGGGRDDCERDPSGGDGRGVKKPCVGGACKPTGMSKGRGGG